MCPGGSAGRAAGRREALDGVFKTLKAAAKEVQREGGELPADLAVVTPVHALHELLAPHLQALGVIWAQLAGAHAAAAAAVGCPLQAERDGGLARRHEVLRTSGRGWAYTGGVSDTQVDGRGRSHVARLGREAVAG